MFPDYQMTLKIQQLGLLAKNTRDSNQAGKKSPCCNGATVLYCSRKGVTTQKVPIQWELTVNVYQLQNNIKNTGNSMNLLAREFNEIPVKEG